MIFPIVRILSGNRTRAVGAFLNWFTVWEVGKDKRLVSAIQNKNSVAGEAYFRQIFNNGDSLANL